MPNYRRASFSGDSVSVGNERVRVDVHRRLTGWGWAEIFSTSGKYLGVLDHLGEVMLRDQEMPMRLEADTYERTTGDFGERLRFRVKSMIVQQKLSGTSFAQWIHYPFNEHVMEGEVVLTVPPGDGAIQLTYRLIAKGNYFVKYIRGPWLKVGEGEGGFGTAKHDAIFPGIEWLDGDEWSSGTDWFKDPWAQRFVPHPNKVSIPVMAISHEGTAISLSWQPNQAATRWFNYRVHKPQPVFAAPNFIDRMNNQIMGLMVPDAQDEHAENQVYAAEPLELHPDQTINFDAEINVVEGTSLDAIAAWVGANGMPRPPEPRWPLEDALHRIASAYNDRFWVEGKGFGFAQHPGSESPHEPGFAEAYISRNADSRLADELGKKIEWCRAQEGFTKREYIPGSPGRLRKMSEQALREYGEKLLASQREDGAFTFDPDGRHYRKDDFVVAREYLEPMGQAGDSALDICIEPAAELLALFEVTGDVKYRDAAKRVFEFCMPLERPEAGDFWETPLHSPNLLAAGHAANAYMLAYRVFGDERYRNKAVHWIRSVLPFTHLWQPKEVPQMYNTKPCLCSSDWYFANWVRDHVQWEVLTVFADSSTIGIDWREIDPAIDWHTYQEGITVAALRWMIDHRDGNWQPHNLPWTLELYGEGKLNDCYADTHNSVTGNYGGMVIPPDPIAVNLLAVLERKGKK